MSDELMKPTGDLSKDPPEDMSWVPDFKQAVFFLAGVYAAERVREAQRYTRDRGYNLTAKEVAKKFAEAAEFMTQKIQGTTETGSVVTCPDCCKGYVYIGPGKTTDDWTRCERCGGTGKVDRGANRNP